MAGFGRGSNKAVRLTRLHEEDRGLVQKAAAVNSKRRSQHALSVKEAGCAGNWRYGNLQTQHLFLHDGAGGIAPSAEYDRGRIAAETVECLALDFLNGLAPEQRANGFAGRIALGADEKSEHGI